jgi:hypothetical protein
MKRLVSRAPPETVNRLKTVALAALPFAGALLLASLSVALHAQGEGGGAEAQAALTERQKAMQSMMAAMDPEARARMTVPDPYELLPDNRVTFRLKAPQAQNVVVRGSWPGGLGGDTRVPMARDESGIWSATTGPLPSDLQSFAFEVDGVTVQPSNGAFGEITRGLAAGDIAVPGGIGADYADKGHAKGVLSYPYVPFMGSEKHLTVYTPPGYQENSEARYPVLYVTMGGRHDGTTGLGDGYPGTGRQLGWMVVFRGWRQPDQRPLHHGCPGDRGRGRALGRPVVPDRADPRKPGDHRLLLARRAGLHDWRPQPRKVRECRGDQRRFRDLAGRGQADRQRP